MKKILIDANCTMIVWEEDLISPIMEFKNRGFEIVYFKDNDILKEIDKEDEVFIITDFQSIFWRELTIFKELSDVVFINMLSHKTNLTLDVNFGMVELVNGSYEIPHIQRMVAKHFPVNLDYYKAFRVMEFNELKMFGYLEYFPSHRNLNGFSLNVRNIKRKSFKNGYYSCSTLVENFCDISSDKAQRLMMRLATSPLTMETMKALSKDYNTIDHNYNTIVLAEVFNSTIIDKTRSEENIYTMRNDVREYLLKLYGFEPSMTQAYRDSNFIKNELNMSFSFRDLVLKNNDNYTKYIETEEHFTEHEKTQIDIYNMIFRTFKEYLKEGK